MSSFIYITIGVLLNVFASILVKLSYVSGFHLSLRNPLSFILNIYVWGSIILYGISFVSYAKSLQILPLNIVQPITTGGVVFFTSFLSFFIFSEELIWRIHESVQDHKMT